VIFSMHARELHAIVGLSPFEHPDVGLVAALARAGALGVLDLGHDATAADAALKEARRRVRQPFGVRFPEGFDASLVALPPLATVVVVPASNLPAARAHTASGDRTLLVQVHDVAEARAAIAAGAHGLIVKGHEAGGHVGDETTFVLLQRVIAEAGVPVWAQGGIGMHTAAACFAAGARGVVLDSQLALLDDAATSQPMRRALGAMDGSETTICGGYRLYARPNAATAGPDDGPERVVARLGADDPARHLVTLGQDAAFARSFADRYATVERVVRAMRTCVDGALRAVRTLRPFARRSGFAEEFGIEFPIAQGPMTRVSDRAAFAEAVSDAGGLPFLALSLMRGEELRTLLDETRTRLAGRTWGVGILGFLPADVREEQLAQLREARPPVVLIAGGRPSQSAPLEDAGIKTFLHVPSPGLLELFLKDGARRFVFEGRECGGHVGPRSSFTLWESAVELLLARERLSDLSILFAGGIHDALSARMVAALAAPLAARGAKVGVLMGTAYVFTHEAVACGAIQPAFQEEALLCERTALLETAPGHATRCIDTGYVRAFERERARLAAEGCDAQTAWAALEQLNLGRLRIASKGLRREDGRLTRVDGDEQRREGMFMIGQVAALRSAPCTIAELHAEVSDGATAALAALDDPRVRPPRERGAVDVAIVGMACIFPDAPDLAAYWKNVVVGHNAVREVPRERWNAEVYYDPAGTGAKTNSKWGGFLPPTVFDPGAYGIPPRSLAAIDPVQLLSLEVAQRALDDAGYDVRPLERERASVVFGTESGGDLANAHGFRANFPQYLGDMPPELDAVLPKLTEDSFPGVLGNVIAGRIANRLDLRGVNYTVDAACASSLAAVDIACKELASGTSDVVVAGGADLHNGVHDFLMFSSVHALSPTGQCRPFDAQADGIALGEGVAAVVLKRLDDAERDGDRVYAVLKGVGGSSDGKSLGLTAPRKEGQLRAMERAWARAGLPPAEVGLVEAHGTGTVVGDRTELATLAEFFGAAGATAASCTLGSVKAQIGHTKTAAGLAGLIKAALAVHHGVLPPTKNVRTPNPAYDAATSTFVLRDVAAPWIDAERVAAVSAFGFGGTNFHAVIEAHGSIPLTPALIDWPAELFVVRAFDATQARRTLEALALVAASEAPPPLRDLAASAAASHADAPPHVAIVATSLADLRAKVAAALEGRAADGVHRVAPLGGDVAFLFPGQGSQRPRMLAELFVCFPELRDLLELGREWFDRLYPGAAFTPEMRGAQQRSVTDTRVAQPALGIANLAMARLLERVGVRPAMTGGHSYGELVALAVAGSIDARTLIALSSARARCILEAAQGEPGTMAAISASPERVREILGAAIDVTLANHNAPEQVVIAGTVEAVESACERLSAAGISSKRIPVACAFHSPIVAGARASFGAELARAPIAEPAIRVYANATADAYPQDADGVRALLADALALPVRFAEQIEAMYAAGARVFVEAGPGGVLSDLVGRILRERPHLTIACDANEGGLTSFLGALARLVAAGVDVDAGALFARRGRQVDLAAPERFAAPPTAWIVDGGSARPMRGELPDFAMRPLAAPVAAVAPPGGDREGVVREYLRTVRELVEGQRQVMLRYLDPAAAVAAMQLDAALTAPASAPAANGAAVTGFSEEGGLPALTPLEALVATVSERTGYPPDMLDPELDLEADLGVDSIKRIEILGAVRERLGLRLGDETSTELVEQLAAAKTLRAMARLLEQHAPGGEGPAERGPEAPATAAPAREPAVIGRYVVDLEALPPAPNGVVLADRVFAVVPDGLGVAAAFSALLEREGARAQIVAPGEPLGEVDGLVHLETLVAATPEAIRSLFVRAKEATHGNAEWVFAATGFGGRFGHHLYANGVPPSVGGASGLLKSLAREQPALRVRAIDLDPTDEPARLAEHVLRELLADERHVEVGYAAGERYRLVAAARDVSDAEKATAVAIDAESVVLITGGARGIAARIAIEMARRYRCTLELVGRSPLHADDEDDEMRAAVDATALRRVLVARMNGAGPSGPAAIEAQCRQILAEREIRATLHAIRSAGARVEYHAADVRHEGTFGPLIDGLVARHGRIDGVLHAAGLIEDKLIGDKTPESFDRVFSTKVSGALTLAARLAEDARFFVLFSSVSSAFGNRGQTDYAAANDALDKLAHHLQRTMRGRVLCVNWGPWSGAGMVGPELEREYERRGIGLIPLEAGVDRFFAELHGGCDPQVILSAAPAGALG
jgi:acyl transferase domain-containing protein/NAD(P)H-dependent flavin oxidoreductase YrpB (nitropropane dioxygenase family)